MTETATWRKSSLSNGSGNCVEAARLDSTTIGIRDSKYTGPADQQPFITVPADEWPRFLALALEGETAPAGHGVPGIEYSPNGVVLRDAFGTVLSYTPAEWEAFTGGIHAGELTLAQLSTSAAAAAAAAAAAV